MDKLHLPCLRGQIGEWAFFSTIMKIKDIVVNNRIITVNESEELYTKNINEILQRELNASRISSLKKYLTTNKERFFSSLIVAIHKGDPKWSDFDIEERFKMTEGQLNPEEMKFIENKTGILSLSGSEEIFALDGQHRLKGLKAAYKENPEIGEEDLSLIFLVHNHNLKERTRRLFTVLNKYAEKPKGAELIILDEDDAAAILTRKLVSEHPKFKNTKALSNSNNGSLPNNDLSSLTTLVTIHQINRILFQKPSSYYKQRPTVQELDELYKTSVLFWETFFKSFPELVKFINGEKEIMINGSLFNRNAETGGSLLLRPVGQVLYAKIYKEFQNRGAAKLKTFNTSVRLIDFNLNGSIWKYIYWNESMLSKNDKLKKSLFNYLLNNSKEEKWITEQMTEIYKKHNLTYKKHIKPLIKK